MLPERAVRWVTDVIGPGSRIVSARRLRLGGWHVNHAVDVLDGSAVAHRLVLRRWARAGWELEDPDYTVEREARVLDLLASSEVPAPVLVAADPAGERCDVPAILLVRLPGHPPGRSEREAAGFCHELAEALACIHGIASSAGARLDTYRLYYDRVRATPARWMPASSVWRRAAAAVRHPPPPTAMTLIHRDYHPENTLWSRRRLTGVVDWTQASWGPAALDVGHMRWNLILDHGPEVADRFLACYRAATGAACEEHAYWDLISLLDLLLDGDEPGDITPDDLRRLEDYASAALAHIR